MITLPLKPAPTPILFFQIPPSFHYPAGASGAPSQAEIVVGQMAVRIVAHKPWGGRHLLMEDKWDKTRMRNGSQTRGGRGININKWKGGGKTWKYMYLVLLVCFPWCHRARQKRQLANRLALRMTAQHVTVACKSGQAQIIPIRHLTTPLDLNFTQCFALLLNVRKSKACWPITVHKC